MSFGIPGQDTEIRFATKFGGNRLLRSFRKVVWFTTHKKLALRGTRPSPHFAQNGPIAPKITWTSSPLDMSTCTEFDPDRLRFAGLIAFDRLLLKGLLTYLFRKNWFFGPKSHYNIVFQPTTNSDLSPFVTVKCERSGHCGVNSGLRINTFSHTVRLIQFLTVKCHFWLDLDTTLIAWSLYDCQSVDHATFLLRDAMHKCGVCRHAVSVRPSVRPSVMVSVMVSVMFVYSVETNKCIFRYFSPSGSHDILVFPYLTGV